MATINLGAIKFNWKGAYAGGTAYTVDDVVSSGGSSYVCILASTGNATSNGTYWEQMSSAGTNGTDGTDLTSTLTTQGDILYRDGSGLQRLAKGTANQELRINSGATAPEWYTPAVASSDYVKLGTGTLSASTSLSIDGLFSSTYKFYEYRIRQIYNSTADQEMRLYVNVGGSAVTTSSYRFVTSGARRTSGGTLSAVQEGGWNAPEIVLGNLPPASDEYAYGILRIYDPLGSTRTGLDFQMSAHKNGEVHVRSGSGYYTTATAVSGITISTSGGNMTIPEINLYGVK